MNPQVIGKSLHRCGDRFGRRYVSSSSLDRFNRTLDARLFTHLAHSIRLSIMVRISGSPLLYFQCYRNGASYNCSEACDRNQVVSNLRSKSHFHNVGSLLLACVTSKYCAGSLLDGTKLPFHHVSRISSAHSKYMCLFSEKQRFSLAAVAA